MIAKEIIPHDKDERGAVKWNRKNLCYSRKAERSRHPQWGDF